MQSSKKRNQPEASQNELVGQTPSHLLEPPLKKLNSSASPLDSNTPIMALEKKQPIGVDEDLYSRQLGAYGMETMGKLIKMRVLVVGLNGTGVEVVKNLSLAGPQSITICDETTVVARDLGANCFLREQHIGMTRCEAVLPGLAELNDYVLLSSIQSSAITASYIADHVDCVVVCGIDITTEQKVQINQYCRDAEKLRDSPVPFISAFNAGLSTFVFSDFGNAHTIHDKNGENEKVAIVQSIVLDGDVITVSLSEDKLNPFQTGDMVTFDEVEGIVGMNGIGPLAVTVTSKYSFTVTPTEKLGGVHEGGGIVKEVKVPFKKSFLPLNEALRDPARDGMFVTPDFSCFDRPVQLHLAHMAVDAFRVEEGRLPLALSIADADKVVHHANALIESKVFSWAPDALDEKVVRFVSYLCTAEISPLASFAGGVAAQEVVKATGKFMPLDQFLHLDYFHMITDVPNVVPEEDDRYRDMKLIFGDDMFNRFQKARMFLVGAGALGCEFLKMFSLMGLCAQDGGKLTVTDMDTIENSNLNRQFLFRKRHLGKMKSEVAAEAAHEMNNHLNVAPTQTRVGKETEDFFDDRFWSELDCVVNALDNVDSRLYVDSRCVWFNKPLLESGTLGTKCNSQVVVPKLTESYGDSQDPPEESIPLCTLKNFPYLIDHCLQWSRDTFQGVFFNQAEDLALAMKDFDQFATKLKAEGFPKMQIERIEATKSLLKLGAAPTVEGAVALSTRLLMTLHNHPMKQLRFNFPPDHITSEGTKFWSGTKRLPHPIEFDRADPMITGFICSATRILSNVVGYEGVKSFTDIDIMDIAANIDIPVFTPDSSAKIQVEENEENPNAACVENEDDVDAALDVLKKLLTNDLVIEPEVFEKDDDANHHIDFVHACGNLRAMNYTIKTCARHESKLIAGKIIPALATTTAMITGIVCMEMLKTFDKTRPIEDYRNSFMNIAIPVWILSEPVPPKKNVDCQFDPVIGGPVIARPSGFTVWDKVEVTQPNCTVKELIDYLETTYQVEASVISAGNKMLYMSYMPAHKNRLDVPIVKLLETVTGIATPQKAHTIALETACNDIDSGDDVVLPQIMIRILK